jgi:hypothetical protein
MSLEIKHIYMSPFGAFFHSHWWKKILTMHGMGKTCQVVYGVFVHSNGVQVINARGAGMHEERCWCDRYKDAQRKRALRGRA